MLTSSPNTSSSSYEFPSRRVSFDLSHNKIHLLPTLEECRDAAKQRSREEWQRKTLNEDMLSEDIIVEIQEDCSASSRNSDSEDEKEVAEPVIEIKSCLKKPPVVVTVTPTTSNNKKKSTSSSKKNQNKRKRSHSKSHVDVTNVISVH